MIRFISRVVPVVIAAVFLLVGESFGMGFTVYSPSGFRAGDTFKATLHVDSGSYAIKSYRVKITYRSDVLESLSAEPATSLELNSPITADFFFSSSVVVMDSNNYSQGCSTMGIQDVAMLEFLVLDSAGSSIGTPLIVSVENVMSCSNENITGLFTSNIDGNTIISAPVASTSGVTQYLDLNGDGYFTYDDTLMMKSLVNHDISNTTNMGLNAGGIQADINGNGLVDDYDFGFMMALTHTVAWCTTGDDGVADTVAWAFDNQVVPYGSGRPYAMAITWGPDQILQTTPSGDDTIKGYYISTGPDGIVQTTASGDDQQLIGLNKGFPNAVMIEPGPDGTIETDCNYGDDMVVSDIMDTSGMLLNNPIPGAPARLVKVSPKQDPYFVRQYTDVFSAQVRSPSVALAVRVEDDDGNPRVGLAPTFMVVQGTGYFDGPMGSSGLVNGLVSDQNLSMGEYPKGSSMVVFHPSLGVNQVMVTLQSDPTKGVVTTSSLFFNIVVVSALTSGGFPDHLTIEPGSRDVSLGDTTAVTVNLTKLGSPVHGLQDRIVMVSERNMTAGFSPISLGLTGLTSIFNDLFEYDEFPHSSPFGDWQVLSGGAYITRDNTNPGLFGFWDLHIEPVSPSAPISIMHTVDTVGYRDISISYQWSYNGSTIGGDYFLVEYSTDDGTSWRQIQNASGYNDLYCPGSICASKMTLESRNISGDNSAEFNNNLLLKFTFVANEGDNFWLDNVIVTGKKILFEEDFEGYIVGQIPPGYSSPSRITSGHDGIAQTTADTGDTQVIPVGRGLPYSVCVYPSLDNTLQTTEAGDDFHDTANNFINSGDNGVCESVAMGDDFQNIPYGQGLPFSEIVIAGSDNYLNTASAMGDDRMQSVMGPNPDVVVDSTIGSNPGGSQGHSGSQKFLKIARATSGTPANYVFRKIVNAAGYENVWMFAFTRTLSMANIGGTEPDQEWVCEVSDNGGDTFIPVWNSSDLDETGWTRHKTCLSCDSRIHMVNNLIVQWRAVMNGTETGPDPDAAYVDDITVIGTPIQPDTFGPIIDTNDGFGNYTTTITSITPGISRISAYVLPYNIGDFPLAAAQDDFVQFHFRKVDPESVRVLPETFTVKACETMDFSVVGHYSDQPGTIVDDITSLYNFEVFGPAQITAEGRLTADCFMQTGTIDIFVNAVPKVAGLYDPGGGGGGEQTGYLSGKVFSSVFPYPGINGSRIRVEGGSNYSTSSGSDGSYLKSGVPVGTYTAKAFKSGYIMESSSGVTITAGQTTTLNLFQDGGTDTDGDTTLDASDTDDDNDGRTDSNETSIGTTTTDPDSDGDNYSDSADAFPTNAGEQLDTDSDGTGNNADTDDDGDGISDAEENAPGTDGYVTNRLLTDTDGDTLGDYAEVHTHLTDPSKADTDGGGRADGAEITLGKNPRFNIWNDDNYAPTASAGHDNGYPTGGTAYLDGHLTSDPEADTINYTWVKLAGPAAVTINNSSTSFANFNGTFPGVYTFSLQVKDSFTPQAWGTPDNVVIYIDADTDGDTLPNNMEGVLGSNSSLADTDNDSIGDRHEFWNTTTLIAASDPVCNSVFTLFSLYCWGDTDHDGVVSGLDVINVKNMIASKTASFPAVYPNNGDTANVDGDITVSGTDVIVFKNWLAGKEDFTVRPPSSLTKIAPTSNPTAPVGSTHTITLQVKNASNFAVAGVGVVFTISGNGILLGGRGSAEGMTDPDGGTFPAGSRWDISSSISSNGYVTMTVLVTGSGQITVNAKIPPNTNKGLASSVILGSPVIINP